MTYVRLGLINITNVEICGSEQGFSNIASKWVVAVLSANEVGLKTFIN